MAAGRDTSPRWLAGSWLVAVALAGALLLSFVGSRFLAAWLVGPVVAAEVWLIVLYLGGPPAAVPWSGTPDRVPTP